MCLCVYVYVYVSIHICMCVCVCLYVCGMNTQGSVEDQIPRAGVKVVMGSHEVLRTEVLFKSNKNSSPSHCQNSHWQK